ncbi:hypothetical protein Peur_001919 [Populus x canadensis]
MTHYLSVRGSLWNAHFWCPLCNLQVALKLGLYIGSALSVNLQFMHGLTFFFPQLICRKCCCLLTDAESNGSQELRDDYRFARNFMVQRPCAINLSEFLQNTCQDFLPIKHTRKVICPIMSILVDSCWIVPQIILHPWSLDKIHRRQHQ